MIGTDMKIQIICFTDNGEKIAKTLSENCPQSGFEPVIYRGDKTQNIVGECFKDRTPIIFISACGIAVRFIAPFVKDKLSDPSVIVMDELACFVIPVLSGHVGGGNALADRIAELTGAVNVTTTATDIHKVFSPDVFAANNRLEIHNREAIKHVAKKSLEGKPILISIQDYPPKEPCDILIIDKDTSAEYQVESCIKEEHIKEEFIKEEYIKGSTLWLSSKKYVLGIGCKKGKTAEEIEALAQLIFEKAGIDYSDIYAFGSIDLKAEEEGLLAFSARHGIPFVTFPVDMMKRVRGEFTPSSFVEEVTGVDNVCERAAVLLTGGHGKLVIRKTAMDGVTMALAIRYSL